MDARPNAHPNERTLGLFALGKLDERAARTVDDHLKRCPSCRTLVAGVSDDSFLGRLRDADPAAKAAPGGPQIAGTLSYTPASAPQTPPFDTLPPGLADHPDYEIRGELGRGGMGVVYLAHNKLMGRDEVLKVMGRQVVERPEVLDRFLREIRAVARLRHPNIVAAYSAVRLGPSIVFAMEHVEGLDLARMVKAKGPLPVAHACHFAYQAALGLQHAHEEGLVHRDIKPGNLMLSRKGEKASVKVLDFGLAKATREEKVDATLTREGQALGTPDFIAPEQIMDAQSADIRADIYSLGATLYYLLTGRPPFKANSLYDIYQAHISRDADPLNLVRPEVPSELAALVAKMMAKDPARRFQTPAEVAQALIPFFKKASAAFKTPGMDVSRVEPTGARQSVAGDVSLPTQPATDAGKPLTRRGETVESTVAESRWNLPIDFRERDSSIKARPAAVPAQRPRWLRPAVAAAAGLLMLGLLAWLGGVLRVKTPDGVIVLENLPKDAEVFVDGKVVTVEWPGVGNPPSISAVPGQHKVQVKQGGITTFGDVVTIEAAKSEVLTIRLEPATALGPMAKAPDSPVVAGPDALPVREPERPVATLVDKPHGATTTDCLQPGSVWVGQPGNSVFTVLEREGERLKARFEVGRQQRELNGTVKNGRLRWLARDVKVITGNAGGDNDGKILGDEIAMSSSDPGRATPGTFKLLIQKHASANKAESIATAAEPQARPGLRPRSVLIITGDDAAAHDWRATTKKFQEILGDPARFLIDVTATPARELTDENLAKYDVLLLNYKDTRQGSRDTEWTGANRAAFLKAVKERGKGLYVHHFSSGAFTNPNWTEFEQAVAGGWRTQGHHGPPHMFTVKKTTIRSPISEDLPRSFDHARDELYANSLLPPGSLVLATAYSDPNRPRGTGKDEPVIWVNHYGKGRVVNNVLGHDTTSMSDQGYQDWVRRCIAWAGGGAPAVPAATDCLQPGSVWVLEPYAGNFTVLERDGERLKAHLELGIHIREVNATVKGGRLSWRAQDVKVTAGDPGNDNEGKILGDEIPMSWSDPGTGDRGTYKLVIKSHAPAHPPAENTPGSR